jgi:hypothetical protein
MKNTSSMPPENPTPEELQISALLRLKRYELPPEDFHEDFLLEFQRRQRLQALRPTWSERWQELLERIWPEFRVPTFAYGTVGLAAVFFSAWILSVDELPVTPNGAPAGVAVAAENGDTLRLQITPDWKEVLPQPVNIPAQRTVGSLPPHYALQPRPNTEKEPFRF